jgi:hypothetical protein
MVVNVSHRIPSPIKYPLGYDNLIMDIGDENTKNITLTMSFFQ